MSVTITSKSALSILRRAASPPVTVSTLWPSRRRAISNNSQMERSSSQTRMLPTSPSSRSGRDSAGQLRFRSRRRSNTRFHPPQPHYEAGTLAHFRTRPDFAFMRLHNLVDDRQAESGTLFEIRLEGLEDFFSLLRAKSGRVRKWARVPAS